MQIEVFKSDKGKWFWHFRNKGRITADAESFPSKAHAVRAAKSVVKAVLKQAGVDPNQVLFTESALRYPVGGRKFTWQVY